LSRYLQELKERKSSLKRERGAEKEIPMEDGETLVSKHKGGFEELVLTLCFERMTITGVHS
jgi:hypothetical protein